jgi:hypothetical protein
MLVSMGKRKERDQDGPPENVVRMHRAEQIAKVLRTLFRCAVPCVLAFFAYKASESLAGKTTVFEAIFRFFAQASISKWLALVLISLLTAWGVLERRARKKFIARNHPHTKALEAKIWPGRTSSGIREDGDSPRE